MWLPPPPIIGYVAHLRFPSGGQTLIGSRAPKRVLDMWAYLGVFGLVQWATLIGLLLAAALGCYSIDIILSLNLSQDLSQVMFEVLRLC